MCHRQCHVQSSTLPAHELLFIVVLWVSRVYGNCILRVAYNGIIPKSAAVQWNSIIPHNGSKLKYSLGTLVLTCTMLQSPSVACCCSVLLADVSCCLLLCLLLLLIG